MKPIIKYAAASLALVSGGVFAQSIDLPETGNGELALFVRALNSSGQATAHVAFDLNVRLDDILSLAQIEATEVLTGSAYTSYNASNSYSFTYELPNSLLINSYITTFLSSGAASYDWAIIAGDTNFEDFGTTAVQGRSVGAQRYLTTAPTEFINNNVTNARVVGQGSSIQAVTSPALEVEGIRIFQSSGLVDGGYTTSSQFGIDNTEGSPLINGGALLPWDSVTTALGEAAYLYVFSTSGGTAANASRAYLGNQITLNFDGTLTVSGGSTGEVPLPAAAWLFGSALAGLGALSRRRKLVAA